MYNFLVHAHSGFRWIVLATLVYAIIHAATNFNGQSYGPKQKKPGLFALIATHIQFVVGIILYFISPKVQFSAQTMSVDALRFFTVEHLSTMILAVILITIGYVRAKRKTAPPKSFRSLFWFYLIGLVIILAMIPWPFQNYGTNWF